jgi:trimethylamine--corrinoid protein Co-methyltransferase
LSRIEAGDFDIIAPRVAAQRARQPFIFFPIHPKEYFMQSRFEVLSSEEVQRIHAASMEVLGTVGIRVDYPFARELFRSAGAQVDEETQCVRIPETLVRWAVDQAPKQFKLYGSDGKLEMQIGGEAVQFAALGTPTAILDLESGAHRPSTLADLVNHIKLIDGCEYIHCSQMDVWSNDIPMSIIHSEAIAAWARNSRKSFGMGCYGYMPTLDMMRMTAIVAGGKQELRRKPRFFGICSIVSPLQMTQIQVEGMLICAEYGQPVTLAPEGIAGMTAPVTLAGLLAQENANILAHITLAQIFRPGAPVLYGTVSTIANMRDGTVALGAVETGLISAASAQLARSYGLPIRSVGGATESKTEDLQAGVERLATLLPAVLSGVNYITCAGTLDSTMLESDALLVMDDELAGMALRMRRGIEVSEASLALDVIRQVGSSGSYIAEEHTLRNYRKEHYIPRLLVRQPYQTWAGEGSRLAIDHARARAREILAAHKPCVLDPAVEAELEAYRQMVAARPIEVMYQYEDPRLQDFRGESL